MGNSVNICFFSGLGSQHFNMYKELFDSNENFRSLVIQYDTQFEQTANFSLCSFILNSSSSSFEYIEDPIIAISSLYALQYLLGKLYCEFSSVINFSGFSLGEIVASVLAGYFDFWDVLEILIKISRFALSNCALGKSLLLMVPKDYLATLSNKKLYYVSTISERQTVVFCNNNDYQHIVDVLHNEKIEFLELPICIPFHTSLLDALKSFVLLNTKSIHSKGKQPFFSFTYRQFINSLPQEYIWNVLRLPFDLSEGFSKLLNSPEKTYFYDFSPIPFSLDKKKFSQVIYSHVRSIQYVKIQSVK